MYYYSGLQVYTNILYLGGVWQWIAVILDQTESQFKFGASLATTSDVSSQTPSSDLAHLPRE